MIRGPDTSQPIRVGVLVDLEWRETAGGHVKCWERFAEAATRVPDELDLTVHFAGERDEEIPLAENVRYRILRPVLSTANLPLPVKQPDHTDLAPLHRRLWDDLERYDVLHATDAWFSYARTALRYHKEHGTPLVSSTHTDTPNYTRVFTRKVVETVFGEGRVGHWLLDGLKVHRRMEGVMRRRFDRYLAASDHVLASSDADYRRARQLLPKVRVTRLRRGVDKDLFHPRHRDRRLLQQRYGIPADRFLLLFVGRLDDAKRPAVLAKAARLLLDGGASLHVVFVGQGPLRDALKEELGPAATVLDPLRHEQLRDVYAGADLFAFPSATEVMPNVVIEAKASGLPVLVSRSGGSAQMVKSDGQDGLRIDGGHPETWASAIDRLRTDDELRRAIGRAAREWAEREWPSWDDVLRQDLLPAWERVLRRRRVRSLMKERQAEIPVESP